MPLCRQKLFFYIFLLTVSYLPDSYFLWHLFTSGSHLSFQPITLLVFGFVSRKGQSRTKLEGYQYLRGKSLKNLQRKSEK